MTLPAFAAERGAAAPGCGAAAAGRPALSIDILCIATVTILTPTGVAN